MKDDRSRLLGGSHSDHRLIINGVVKSLSGTVELLPKRSAACAIGG